ncbi:hypothetical protein GCM10025787_32070 [Saccharopolyspora rosea]
MCCALLVVALAVPHVGQARPGWFDGLVGAQLAEWFPGDLRPLDALASLGSTGPVLAETAIVASIGYLNRRWTALLLPAVGTPLAVSTTELLKPVVGRTINGHWAMPSGHTTAVVSLLVAALLVSRRSRPGVGPLAAVLIAALALGAVGMALGLVRLGFHYATDVAAGACVATAVVLLTARALDVLDWSIRLLRTIGRAARCAPRPDRPQWSNGVESPSAD